MQQKTLLIILGNLAVISLLAITAVVMLKNTSNTQDVSTRAQVSTASKAKPTPTSAKAAAAAEVARDLDSNIVEIDKAINSFDIDKEITQITEKDFQ